MLWLLGYCIIFKLSWIVFKFWWIEIVLYVSITFFEDNDNPFILATPRAATGASGCVEICESGTWSSARSGSERSPFYRCCRRHHPISLPLDSLCCEFSTVSIGLIFYNLSSIQDVSKCRITFNLFAVMLQLSLFIFSIQTHLVDYVTQDFLIRLKWTFFLGVRVFDIYYYFKMIRHYSREKREAPVVHCTSSGALVNRTSVSFLEIIFPAPAGVQLMRKCTLHPSTLSLWFYS